MPGHTQSFELLPGGVSQFAICLQLDIVMVHIISSVLACRDLVYDLVPMFGISCAVDAGIILIQRQSFSVTELVAVRGVTMYVRHAIGNVHAFAKVEPKAPDGIAIWTI